MPRRRAIGIVTSDKMAKTRRVEVPRTTRHPLYGKVLHRRTICYVHDENNESRLGDRVEIEESRPLSRLKRWRLVRIVERSREIDLAALKAARSVEALEQGESSGPGEATSAQQE
ncbi:MAG: 30S ribosomal protein S17 [Pirellulaceae bacterium]|nr:MAG: 30S ribosomal protein S17 [Pirellulaceae bacterium]GIW94650.1 MAG: 30S ribosomal protein S17 [Pirellulaceae bacterium]